MIPTRSIQFHLTLMIPTRSIQFHLTRWYLAVPAADMDLFGAGTWLMLRHTLLVKGVKWIMVGLLPLVLVMAFGGGWWLARRALKPVGALTKEARSINAGDLTARLSVPSTGAELQELAEAWNEMLQRFQDSFIRMRRFTADESHELRTLLTGLRATAELALRRPRKAHEYREALTKIVGISARIAELGEELLALARGDQYDLTISPGTVNVSAVVHEIVNEMKSLFAAKELKIELSLPPQPVIVHADASGLRRLLAALLDNAQKYTPQHGRIDVAVRSDDSEIEISVSDTGCGIPESEMSRIFDRFYRVDSSRDRETGGYGLGLAIAQQVAVAHKGTLDAVNLPSRGMVFRFRMPIIAAPSTG